MVSSILPSIWFVWWLVMVSNYTNCMFDLFCWRLLNDLVKKQLSHLLCFFPYQWRCESTPSGAYDAIIWLPTVFFCVCVSMLALAAPIWLSFAVRGLLLKAPSPCPKRPSAFHLSRFEVPSSPSHHEIRTASLQTGAVVFGGTMASNRVFSDRGCRHLVFGLLRINKRIMVSSSHWRSSLFFIFYSNTRYLLVRTACKEMPGKYGA